MAKIKNCRVCGKPYEVCRSYEDYSGTFHWQDVSCSVECGAEYLRRVMDARNPAPKKMRMEKRAKIQEIEVVETVVSNEKDPESLNAAE